MKIVLPVFGIDLSCRLSFSSITLLLETTVFPTAVHVVAWFVNVAFAH